MDQESHVQEIDLLKDGVCTVDLFRL
jgi:hypothetical protein